MTHELPVDEVLPALRDELERAGVAVLVAPPGAGKSTRVPLALLADTDHGQVLVTQPRRLAARMLARHVARLHGSRLGETVGYRVRFDAQAGPRTRLVYMTEGLLARKLASAPDLPDASLVILDEFHERHLDGDLALGLLRRARQQRPDLRLLVMSATLDAEVVASALGAAVIRSEGRAFPVEVEHRAAPKRDELAPAVARCLRESPPTDGDTLVFLPGRREIEACLQSARAWAADADVELAPLHGQLDAAAQDRAVQQSNRPKVIFATNVAETSVTVPGVTTVIDTGLARVAFHDPHRGLPSLRLQKISRAAATQRAGRAGRVQAGRCIRLYDSHDHARRSEHESPEIERLDPCQALLRAALTTGGEPFPWLTAPPVASVERAEVLLRRLEAIDPRGGVTEFGRRLAQWPQHPRLGALCLWAQDAGLGALATSVAAVLEDPPRRANKHGASGWSDVFLDVEALDQARGGLPPAVRERIRRVRDRLRTELGLRGSAKTRPSPPSDDDQAKMCELLLRAFPDRLGRVRVHEHQRRVVFADGGEALLDPDSVVREGLLVALDAGEVRSGARTHVLVRSAASVELDMVLQWRLDDVEESVAAEFDRNAQRVVVHEELRIGSCRLDRSPVHGDHPAAADVLRAAARDAGPAAFVESREVFDRWLARLRFAAEHDPRCTAWAESDVQRVLDTACDGRRSFAELRRADLLRLCEAQWPPEMHEALRSCAPTSVQLPGGRKLRIQYAEGRDPWAESRLQDFFGMATGPTLGSRRVPLVLHLLAPNRRAVQVTTDLAGFWERHYPDLRKQLMRRYPRHDWPDDPITATPPKPRPRRPRR